MSILARAFFAAAAVCGLAFAVIAYAGKSTETLPWTIGAAIAALGFFVEQRGAGRAAALAGMLKAAREQRDRIETLAGDLSEAAAVIAAAARDARIIAEDLQCAGQ